MVKQVVNIRLIRIYEVVRAHNHDILERRDDVYIHVAAVDNAYKHAFPPKARFMQFPAVELLDLPRRLAVRFPGNGLRGIALQRKDPLTGDGVGRMEHAPRARYERKSRQSTGIQRVCELHQGRIVPFAPADNLESCRVQLVKIFLGQRQVGGIGLQALPFTPSQRPLRQELLGMFQRVFRAFLIPQLHTEKIGLAAGESYFLGPRGIAKQQKQQYIKYFSHNLGS